MHRRSALLALAAISISACSKSKSEPLRIAAASDLTKALPELSNAFTRVHGDVVTCTFGSSGLLAKQIEEGAPFDVFASADASYVDALVQKGACLADSRTLYARGKLAIYAAKTLNSPPTSVTDLTFDRFKKIAIANPEHAPYGRAARDVLRKQGVWDRIQDRLVYAENIQQTLQFAKTGNADVAIVSESLLVGEDGTKVSLDPSMYAPIEQAIAVCSASKRIDSARAFVRFVVSPEGRTILARFGFSAPGGSLSP